MKKAKKIIPILSALIITATATIIHSKADMKIEQTDFSVSTDNTQKPSAYCMMSDGSQIPWEQSFSGYFCIPGCNDNNVNMMSFDGIPAYCIGRHDQKSPTTTNQVDKCTEITLDTPEYAQIFSITALGYGCSESAYGLNDIDFYYVTQCAIRSMLYGIPIENLAFYDTDGNINPYMNDEFARLRNSADTPLANNENTMTVISDTATVSEPIYIEDDCYFRYGPFSPYCNFDFGTYNVNFADENDYIFLSESPDASVNEDIFTFEQSDEFYVYINALCQDEIIFSLNTDVSDIIYDPVIYLTHDDTYQDIAQMKLTDRTETVNTEFSLRNTDTTGDMVINKIFRLDDKKITDDKLTIQPRFTIKNSEGKYVNGIYANDVVLFTNFTDTPVEYPLCVSSSSLTVENLPIGDYIISESQGAEGYMPIHELIEMRNSSETDTIDFINYKSTPPETVGQPSETTTTTQITTPSETTTTTTQITTSETTTTEQTTTSESTTTFPEFSITTTAFSTYITTSDTPQTTTVSETTSETTVTTTPETTPAPPVKTTPRSMPPRVYQSPPTGDTTPFPAIISAFFLSLTTAVALRRKK